MLDAYIEAQGINPKVPPIEILDPNFAAEVSRKGSDRAKAADMENALRHHISISFDRDPAKFKSLSERLESILSSHHEDWQEIAKRLRILIDEARAASSLSGAPQGMEPNTEAPIFGVLRTRAGTTEKDVEVAELACEIVRRLRAEAAISGFWDNTVAQEETRRWIFQQLDNSNLFQFSDLDSVSSDCMGVSRANRGAFRP
jgi:type I restriction enzyme R subunit